MCKNWDLNVMRRRYRAEEIQEVFAKNASSLRYVYCGYKLRSGLALSEVRSWQLRPRKEGVRDGGGAAAPHLPGAERPGELRHNRAGGARQSLLPLPLQIAKHNLKMRSLLHARMWMKSFLEYLRRKVNFQHKAARVVWAA
jgi:hypothetical protein